MLASRVLPHRWAAPCPSIVNCPRTPVIGGHQLAFTRQLKHVSIEPAQRCALVAVAAKKQQQADVEEAPKERTAKDPKNTAPEVLERGAPEHPYPGQYQQTLNASFTLGGVGVHTGEYATVRVRPAFANEGRYFVRVPDGTNASRYITQQPVAVELEQGGQAPLEPELEEKKLELFKRYLIAQEDDGFEGTFDQYLHAIDAADLTQRWEAGANVSEAEFTLPDPEDIQPRGADEVVLAASLDAVHTPGAVTISLGGGDEDEDCIISVQPLLAALEAAGVDNARIEIEGGNELPQLDGSALGWAMGIQLHGVRVAPTADGSEEAVPRRGLLLSEPFTMNEADGSFISFVPELNMRLTAGVDEHQVAPIIGKQWKSWCLYEDLPFRFELAGARQWVSSPESLEHLAAHGYYKGATDGTLMVAYGDRWFDPELMRHVDDEAARHQVMTLMGVLALTARPGHAGLPFGHIVSYRATTETMLNFARHIVSRATEDDYIDVWDVPLTTDFVPMNEGDELIEEGEADLDEDEEGFDDEFDEFDEDEYVDEDEDEDADEGAKA